MIATTAKTKVSFNKSNRWPKKQQQPADDYDWPDYDYADRACTAHVCL